MKKMVQKQLEARSNKSDTLKSEHFKFALNHVKGKTLDIGCGYGWFVELNPKDFYGIEVDSKCVKECKKKGLKVQKAFADNLPYPDDFFDTVFCWGVIEHLTPSQVKGMFFEIKRVLKSNGTIIIGSHEFSGRGFWSSNYTHVRPYPSNAIKELFKFFEIKYVDVFYKPVKDFFLVKLLAKSDFLSTIIEILREDYVIIGKKP